MAVARKTPKPKVGCIYAMFKMWLAFLAVKYGFIMFIALGDI